MDICRDRAVRFYPSALNRAGRIFADRNVHVALEYLDEGIDQARKVGDGWFYVANLVEHAELCFRYYHRTQSTSYLRRLGRHADELEEALTQYDFPDLRGRWLITQGHLGVLMALEYSGTERDRRLEVCFNLYADGFLLIATGPVGSHGVSALPGEFAAFRTIWQRLTRDEQDTWYREFQTRWSGNDDERSIALLASLQSL